MHKNRKTMKNIRLNNMKDADIPSFLKMYIRALNRLNILVIIKVSLIFFPILFVFENTGIKKNSAKPTKMVNAITLTEVM